MKTLEDLFIHTLKDIYHAEKQALRVIPKMVKTAHNLELKQALKTHFEETIGQVERLEQIFEMIGRAPRREPCEAVQALVQENNEILGKVQEPHVREAALIAANQAIEHYEIARYSTLKAWAQQLGLNEAVDLINETLEEEKKTNKILTRLATIKFNEEATALKRA